MLLSKQLMFACLTITCVSAAPIDRRFGALDVAPSMRSGARAIILSARYTSRDNVDEMMDTNGDAKDSTNSEDEEDGSAMNAKDDSADSSSDIESSKDDSTSTAEDEDSKSTEDTSSDQGGSAPPPPSTECVLNKLIVASGTTETKLTLRDLLPLVQSDKTARANVQDALDNLGIAGETLADLAEVVASGQAVPQDKLDTLVAAFNATGTAINAMKSDENSVSRIMKQAQGEFLQVQQGSDGVLKTCG